MFIVRIMVGHGAWTSRIPNHFVPVNEILDTGSYSIVSRNPRVGIPGVAGTFYTGVERIENNVTRIHVEPRKPVHISVPESAV